MTSYLLPALRTRSASLSPLLPTFWLLRLLWLSGTGGGVWFSRSGGEHAASTLHQTGTSMRELAL